jgi:hypothetical protein
VTPACQGELGLVVLGFDVLRISLSVIAIGGGRHGLGRGGVGLVAENGLLALDSLHGVDRLWAMGSVVSGSGW